MSLVTPIFYYIFEKLTKFRIKWVLNEWKINVRKNRPYTGIVFNELRWLIFHIVLKVVKMYKTNLSLPLVNLFIQLFLYLQLCSRTQKTTRSCIKLNSWTSCHRICVSIHTGRHVTAARRSTHTGDLNLPNTDSNSGENEGQPLQMFNSDVECW